MLLKFRKREKKTSGSSVNFEIKLSVPVESRKSLRSAIE